MIPPLLLTLALVGQVAVPVSERARLPFVVLSPSAQPIQTSRSRLLQVVSESVEPWTRYRVISLEGEELGACRGRLSCLSKVGLRVVPKADRMLILSLLARPEGDIASVLLLNLERTRAALTEVRDPEAATDQRIELELSETGLTWPRDGMAPVSTEVELRRLLEESVQHAFRRSFERAGAWQVYGRLEIGSPVAGLSVMVDGRPVGVTVAGTLRLDNVEVGPRRLAFESVDYVPIHQTIVVSPGDTQQVALDPVKIRNLTRSRSLTILAGGLTTTAGIGLLGFAELDDVRPRSGRGEYLRFGSPPNGRNGEGPAIVPLGLALITAGITWAVGTWLFGEEEEAPIEQWVIGLIAGGSLYVNLMLLEGN
ncbi:MAG: hypothetical protein IPG45_31410 [Deltaproteobacteria bacterium]|nr:hypothetical protein [Deltaproteobacteria bacterium]